MPQPLDDRIAAALKPLARIVDCETALADVRAEREAVTAAKAAADERRLDPEIPAEDAAEAQLDMQEAELRLSRLDRAEQRLVERIGEKRRAADLAEAVRRYDQIVIRRAQLVEDLKGQGRAALETLAGLCARIVESDAEIAAVNASLPAGKTQLESAEIEARGFAGGPGVKRLRDMTVPYFDRPGLAWPDREGAHLKRQAILSAAQERMQETAQAREASKARYVVTWPHKTATPPLMAVSGMVKVPGIGVETDLYAEQVDRAQAQGFTVIRWTPENAVWREYRLSPALDHKGNPDPKLVSTRDGVINVTAPVTAWLNERNVKDARFEGLTVQLASEVKVEPPAKARPAKKAKPAPPPEPEPHSAQVLVR